MIQHMSVIHIDVRRVQQLIIRLVITRIFATLRVLSLDTFIFIRLIITATNFHLIIPIQANPSITDRVRRVKIRIPVYCFVQIKMYISNTYLISFNYKMK